MLGFESLASVGGLGRWVRVIVLGVVDAVWTTGGGLSVASVPSLPTGATEPEEAEVVLEGFTEVFVGAAGTVLVTTPVAVLVGVEDLAEIAVLFAGAAMAGESAFATTARGQR